MKENWKNAFMDAAERFAQESKAVKLKVGAIVVKDNRIISIGVNGTPAGWNNTCEDKVYLDVDASSWLSADDIDKQYPFKELDENGLVINRYGLKTKPEVLHAERNALDKLAKGTESGNGAAIFITHAPCLECAKSIHGTGIKEVFYRYDYRCTKGIEFLTECGIAVSKLSNGTEAS